MIDLSLLTSQYLLHLLEEALPDLLELALVPQSTDLKSPIEQLREAVRQAAIAVLPELIGLTDAFGFSDYILDSDLGRADGRYVESLLERAKATADSNTGNEEQRHQLFLDYIQPILARGERLSKL